MPGFKDETHMWEWMSDPRAKRMKGTWHRLEAVMPDGLPDVIGKFGGRQTWIELKVSAAMSPERLEAAQRDMIPWLDSEHTPVYVAFGSPHDKSVVFVRALNFGRSVVPGFWFGPTTHARGVLRNTR